MKYYDKLKNPKWQKKRLEVLDSSEWKCAACHNHEAMLHVHHIKYTENPWDAPSTDLQCLCADCHKGLGEHPKGGIYYEREYYNDDFVGLILVFIHCPLCGSIRCREKGSYDKCFDCGHPLVPERDDLVGWSQRGFTTMEFNPHTRKYEKQRSQNETPNTPL